MRMLRFFMLLVALAVGAGAALIYHGAAPPVTVNIADKGSVADPAMRPSATTDPALIETTPDGPLPKVAANGRKPMTAYARPFDKSDNRPRIAVIVADIGLRSSASERVIDDLPGVVTLALSPYGDQLPELARKARRTGHELLLQVPMESRNAALVDAGARALLAAAKGEENLKRLHWIMSRITGYVGLISENGDALAARPDALASVWQDVGARGLLYVAGDERSPRPAGSAVPSGAVAIVLDAQPSRKEIETQMRRAEEEAKRAGSVIVMARPYPLSIQLIKGWIASLERKTLAAAPVSAVVRGAER